MKVPIAMESMLIKFCSSQLQRSIRSLGTTTVIFGAVGWMFSLFHALPAALITGAGVLLLLLGLLNIEYEDA